MTQKPTPLSQLPVACQQVHKMNLQGHIIVDNWFKWIKYPTRKPQMNALFILADIVYWYRPLKIENEITGEITGYVKKFSADNLQRNRAYYVSVYGFSNQQAKDAIDCLEKIGVIKNTIADFVDTPKGKMYNVAYIELNTDVLWRITFDDPENDDYAPLGSTDPTPSVLQTRPLGSTDPTYTDIHEEEESCNNNTKPCNNSDFEESSASIGEDVTEPIRFPINEWGDRIPPKFNIKDHPQFIELRQHLFGNLTGMSGQQLTQFHTYIIRPAEEIDGWWEWCLAQAKGNGKGKPWKIYTGFLFKGMTYDTNTGTYSTTLECDFVQWKNGMYDTNLKSANVPAGVTKGMATTKEVDPQTEQNLKELLEYATW